MVFLILDMRWYVRVSARLLRYTRVLEEFHSRLKPDIKVDGEPLPRPIVFELENFRRKNLFDCIYAIGLLPQKIYGLRNEPTKIAPVSPCLTNSSDMAPDQILKAKILANIAYRKLAFTIRRSWRRLFPFFDRHASFKRALLVSRAVNSFTEIRKGIVKLDFVWLVGSGAGGWRLRLRFREVLVSSKVLSRV